MPDMGKLSEEEVEAIRESYEEIGNVKKVADELGHSPQTVSKYTEDMREDSGGGGSPEDLADEPMPEAQAEGEEGVLDFENIFSTSTEVQEDVDFSTLSPGEFIQWFFEEGMSDSPVKNTGVFADRCDAREAIPSEKKMRDILGDLNSKSGYGNERHLKWTAELYWGRAKDYASARTGLPEGQIEQYVMQQDADWVRVDAPNQGMAGGRSESDNTVTPGQFGGGSQQSDRTVRPGQQAQPQQNGSETVVSPMGGGGGGSHGGFNGQGQGQPQPGQQGQMDPAMQQILQQMQQQQEQMMQFMKSQMSQSGSQQQNGNQSIKDQMDELAGAMQALEQVRGDDNDAPDETIQQLKNQIDAVAQQVQETAQQNQAPNVGDGGMEAVFAQLATREDVDTETLTALASQFGVEADPEVKKAEIEKEMEVEKSQRRQEMVNTIFDSAGDAMSQAIPGAVQAVLSGDQQEAQNGQVETGQQGQAQPQQDTDEPQAQTQAAENGEPQPASPHAQKYGAQAQNGGAPGQGGEQEIQLADDAFEERGPEDADDADDDPEPEGETDAEEVEAD